MNIAITQLAFNDNDSLSKKAKELNIDNIELIFSMFNSEQQMRKVLKQLKDSNVKYSTAQSILYNSNIKNLSDYSIVEFVEQFCDKCNDCGVNLIVLGSAKNRQGDKKDTEIVFKKIDDILKIKDIILCIEPNSKIYGGSYFFNLKEITEFIDQNNFKNIRSMVDTFNLMNEGFDPSYEYVKYKKYIEHIHISEKNLIPYKTSIEHQNFSKAIKSNNYSKIITYEAKYCDDIDSSIFNFFNDYS
jgi:sugar phosphate isomerase/epimerase